jgi:hypothetical protein
MVPISAPDWLPENRAHWNAFLNSPTGLVLMARLRAVQGQVATTACADAFHTQHSAGTANGWNECRQWLESLSRSSRVIEEAKDSQKSTDSQSPGEASLAERLSP